MTGPLGLESGVVRLVEYDGRWPSLFDAEARRLRAVSDAPPLRLEHIGSTAVPGMCAKPVLDMLAGRPAAVPADRYVALFSRAGYDYRGEQGVAGREFFRRGQPRAYHVHLVEQGGMLWREYVAFRDYLRTHAEAAARYADLKRSLAARFSRDRDAYVDGKTAFVRDILESCDRHRHFSIVDRTRGCLKGIATGDAIGKQTEMLSRNDVVRWYPQGVRGFEGTPGDVIPRYARNVKRKWRIGETTDDTERTMAVARAIIGERAISHARVGREMLGCTKCVHPGIPSLWEFHQAADPARIARAHDGCGAAVRVAPVGIFYAPDAFEALVNGAREASIPTHGGSLAIAAAAATAAAVSAVIDAAPPEQILEIAARAAAMAGRRWPGPSAADLAGSIRTVHDSLATMSVLDADDVAARWFPNHTLTIVPLALGLATVMRSAEEAILLAANIGGDSDSVASIAGGILGAMYPDTVNDTWCEVVERVNAHGLVPIADELARLRRGSIDPSAGSRWQDRTVEDAS